MTFANDTDLINWINITFTANGTGLITGPNSNDGLLGLLDSVHRNVGAVIIADANVSPTAAIATSKLADGANFLKKDGTVAMTASLSMGTHTLTNLASPVNPDDAVRLVDLQNIQVGLDVKDSVRLATTANITLSGLQAIDGLTTVAGDRVLVKNQTTGANNGIYIAATGAWARSLDANTSALVTSGMFMLVEAGTSNATSGWALNTPDPITLGTTSLSFAQFNGGAQITPGVAIGKTGNTINVLYDTSTLAIIGSNLLALASGVVTAGTYTKLTVDTHGRVTAGAAATPGDIGAQASSTLLTNIAALGTSGIIVNNAGAALARTIVGTAGRIAVTNGNGVSGNPSVDLVSAIIGTPGSYPKVTVDTYGRVTAGGTISTSDLSDLLISGLSTNDLLTYNGTKWVNQLPRPEFFSSFSTIVSDANVSTVTTVATLIHDAAVSSAGIGTALLFQNSNSVSTIVDTASIAGILESTASGSERGVITFNVRNSGVLNEAMRINHLGYIGIGNTNPSFVLDVVGQSHIAGQLIVEDLKVNAGISGASYIDINPSSGLYQLGDIGNTYNPYYLNYSSNTGYLSSNDASNGGANIWLLGPSFLAFIPVGGSFSQVIVPNGSLTANRVLTLPDETGVLATKAYVDSFWTVASGSDALVQTDTSKSLGIKNVDANSTLDVNGSVAFAAFIDLDGTISFQTLDDKYRTYIFAGNVVNIDLPDPSSCPGREYILVCGNASGGAFNFSTSAYQLVQSCDPGFTLVYASVVTGPAGAGVRMTIVSAYDANNTGQYYWFITNLV